MTINFTGIRDALVSHAQTIGRFQTVQKHEPLSAPSGVHAALWLESVVPVTSSGLSATTVRLAFVMRVYVPADMKPVDDVDKQVLEATDRLLEAWSGDFQLDGTVRHVDLLGAYGVPLSAQAGYQRIGDVTFRVMTVTVPMIVNDVWDQGG